MNRFITFRDVENTDNHWTEDDEILPSHNSRITF